MRSTRSIEIPVTWHKLCDDTMGSVCCRHAGYRQSVRWCCSPTFTHAKKDSSNKGREQTTSREPGWGNLASYDERKVDLDDIVRELTMCRAADHSQPREGAEISWSSRQKL